MGVEKSRVGKRGLLMNLSWDGGWLMEVGIRDTSRETRDIYMLSNNDRLSTVLYLEWY